MEKIKYSQISIALLAGLLSACSMNEQAIEELKLLKDKTLNQEKTALSVSSNTIPAGSTATVRIIKKNKKGTALNLGLPLEIKVSTSGGTSKGQLSDVIDHKDGTYSATFKGIKAGTATNIVVLINDIPFEAPNTTIKVVPGPAHAIAVYNGSFQLAPTGNYLNSDLTALVWDAHDNLTPGVLVDWTATDGTLINSKNLTATNGLSTNNIALPNKTGTVAITAKIQGLSLSATFLATAIPASANNSAQKIMTEEINLTYINGTVLTKLDDGNGGYYIGGTFTQVGNFSRQHVAHILADGQVDPDFNPSPEFSVKKMFLKGSTLLISENINTIEAINIDTNEVAGWKHDLTSALDDLILRQL